MRILMVSTTFPPQISGVSVLAENLADELNRRHAVEVIATAPASGYKRPRGSRDRNLYKVHRLPGLLLRANSNMLLARPSPRKVEAIIKAFKPDVIHLHDFNTNSAQLILNASARKKIPIVLTHHFTAEMILKWVVSSSLAQNRLLKNSVYRLVNILYNRCDLIVVPNPALIQVFKASGLRTPIVSIPNGMAVKKFQSRRVPKKLLNKAGFGKPMFLFVGRLDSDKSLHLAVDAFAAVKRRHPAASLVLVGKGVQEKNLKQQAYRLGVGASVHFPGRLDNRSGELSALYQRADVFVSPSIIENQSMSFIEAMSVGLPLVAFAAPLQQGFIANKRNGLLFTPHTAKALARVMDKIVSDGRLRTKIARTNKKAAQQHEISRVADEYVKAYKAGIRRVSSKPRVAK